MSDTPVSVLTGCDYTCQRNKNLQNMRALYEQEVAKYYEAYTAYMKSKYSEDIAARNYAETTLKPQVAKINQTLNTILGQLKSNIDMTDQLVNNQKTLINQRSEGYMKNKNYLNTQDEVVLKRNKEYASKTRQLEFSKERNNYRRIMIIVLVLVNIGLGGLIFYLVRK